MEAYYPDVIKISITINAPKFFPWLFSMLKSTISTRSLEKMFLYGSNKEKWIPAILKHVHKDQLPQAYGGTRKCTREFLEITSRDFEGFSEVFEDFEDEMCAVTIEPGDKFQVVLDVKYTGSLITWKFRTDNFDVDFSIFLEEENKFVVPSGRVESHLKEQSGSYTVDFPGRYVLIFDNTYDLLHSKTLYHFISEVSPEGVKKDDASWGVQIKN